MRASDISHILIRIWKHNGFINHEIELVRVRGCHKLYLDLPDNQRPTDDWITEAVGDAMSANITMFLPDLGDGETIEICEEPIFYEAIGEFVVDGSWDYYGEYDEDYSFDVHEWSVAIDEKME